MPSESDEFRVIARHFAPLATHDGARSLTDDAAVFSGLVITTDAIVEGVHFLASDPINTVAMKSVRVNVSDLVGKGAKPVAALLTLVWPDSRPASEIGVFAEAFGRDLKHFGMHLLGGDTTSTPGPLTVSVTALGQPLGSRVPARGDAKIGEDLWLVGGEIGSAWMGLQLRSGRMALSELQRGRDEGAARAQSRDVAAHIPDYLTLPGADFDAEAGWLMSTYLAPFVRVECAELVARYAGASMDVSDGLVIDAGKMATASKVALRIEANDIPFSIPAMRWLQTGGDFRKLVTGGDDYVVLFTAPPEARAALEASECQQALRLTRIGRVEAGKGVRLVDRAGAPISTPSAGFEHRLGA